ncbi:MAG: hypothetical protein WCX73_00020 [Candidatus Pacearchaeota archaeon]|jgi:hypothetical protein
MVNKKYLIAGIILIVIVIVVLGFYFFGGNKNSDLCKKISDETIKQSCALCDDTENPIAIIDCKNTAYIEFVFLKQDKSLCNNLIQEYAKTNCLNGLEKSLARDGTVPEYEPIDGGYKK